MKNKIIKTPEFVRVEDFGDSAVIIKIIGETQPGEQWEVAGELRKRILEKFREKGIDLPYPQLVVSKKN